MRDGSVGFSAAGSAREKIKRLWKAYFADPSQWWDYRDVKTNSKAPDFEHKTTKDFLWLDRTRNPSWVIPLLKKRDRERFVVEFPPSVLEEEKKGKSSLHWNRYVLDKEAFVVEEGTKKMSYLTWLKHALEKEEDQESPSLKVPTSIRDEEKKTVYGECINSTLLKTVSQEPNLKIKKKVCHSESIDDQPQLKNSTTIIGKVCDWHKLGLEDAIDALEKGSFSEPSVDTLVYIACKCTKKKDLDCALRLLAYMQRNGLDSHKSLGNELVSMLVEVGRMDNAQDVFDKMVSKSECSWNALIKGYVKNRDLSQAIALYRTIRNNSSIHLSGHTFVALLKACTLQKDMEVGRSLYVHISREGLVETNLFVGNALVDMYAKFGSFVEAQEVFDRLPVRDVVTWTALIAGYAQHECGTDALKCYEQMQDSGVSPNEFTFACILKACGSLKVPSLGREIHAKVEQGGYLKTSQIVGNALVDMYAKCGLLEKAQEVFNLLPVRDVISWNALITGYAEHEYSREAVSCFKRMQFVGVSPNAITYASSLKACASIRAIKTGKEIHLDIMRKGMLKKDLVLGSSLIGMYMKCGLLEKAKAVFDKLPIRDAVVWTAMIAGYSQHDAGEKALSCFKQMQVAGVSPDAIAYAFSLKACGSIGATNMGVRIHNEIVDKGLWKGDLLLSNAVVDMYTKCGMLVEAQKSFINMPVHDAPLWTALITGYAHVGDVKNALFVFEKMREDCVNPTLVTLLSILNACSNAGLVDLASAYLGGMSETFSIIPTREHITCMVDLLGRIGQLDTAVGLVMKAAFHPNAVMWLTVLGACQKWGHVKLAREAFEHLTLLDEGESSAYVCMSNIYADAGMHESANKVEEMGVKANLEEAKGLHG